MRNKTKLTLIYGAILLAGGMRPARAQEAMEGKTGYFRLEFVVKEKSGENVMNNRHYVTTVQSGDHRCTIRSGNKVPIQTAEKTLSYIDVGVNIDCSGLAERDGNVTLEVTAEISSMVTTAQPPLVRQTKWNSRVMAAIGKPTTIFSSDDALSKGQTQLELTVTAIGPR